VNFLQLPQEAWSEFFDGITQSMRGRLIEIDVIGFDLGALVEAEWLSLVGMTYEPDDDVLYVYVESPTGGVDHAIERPRRVYVQLDAAGMNQLVVFDADEHGQFLRLRAPRELPEPTSP
jgi:uncharacterized protein YuzE